MESRFWVTVASPKSARRARPESSTRIFGWPGCQYDGNRIFRTATYSLEVPMDDIAGVEVVEAIGDVGQLVTGVSVG